MAGDKWVAPAGNGLTETSSGSQYELTFGAFGDISIGSTVRITASGTIYTVDTGQLLDMLITGPSAAFNAVSSLSVPAPDNTELNYSGSVGWTATYTETLRSITTGGTLGTWAYCLTYMTAGIPPKVVSGTRTRTVNSTTAAAWGISIGYTGAPDEQDTVTLDQAFAETIG